MVIDVLIIIISRESLLLSAVGWSFIPSALVLVFLAVAPISVGALTAMTLPSIIVVVSSLAIVTLGMTIGCERSIIVSLHPSRICSYFITNLATLLAAAELTTWFEPVVPIHSDHHAVTYGAVQGIDSQSCFSSCSILDKAEATRLHFHSVESHYQVDNMSTLAEVL